ncbi:sulfur carrier protein ThiS [Thermomonas alba]|uniref:sulfur carrier protein ThiS n=1 Tax=Thermomonas alba TaxID=2888525 RepID=UPI001F038A7A
MFVNGDACQISEGTSLEELLTHIHPAPQTVATAVNGDFVARAARANLRLQAGDSVACFQPIVGG